MNSLQEAYTQEARNSYVTGKLNFIHLVGTVPSPVRSGCWEGTEWDAIT